MNREGETPPGGCRPAGWRRRRDGHGGADKRRVWYDAAHSRHRVAAQGGAMLSAEERAILEFLADAYERGLPVALPGGPGGGQLRTQGDVQAGPRYTAGELRGLERQGYIARNDAYITITLPGRRAL